jgi:spermidine synthase
LLGIALGSFIIARFIDTRTRLLAWFGSIEVLIGVCAVLAIPILNNSTSVFHSMAGASVDATLHWKWMGMRFVKTLAVMLVPTVLMGMTVPLVTKIFTRSVERVGTALGSVYAVNTIGGVFGSVAAGFALIPLIGVQHSIMVVGAISVALGGVLMFAEPSVGYGARIKMVSGVAVLLVVGGAVYATFSRAMYLTSYYEGVDRPRVLSYTEGIGATVKVYRDRLGNKAVSVNGFPVAGTALAAHDAQKPLAHFPMLLNSVPSPRVNIVGFGAGGTSWGITRYDVAKVDCVELVPAVIEAAPWFPEINHDVLADPRFSVILGDGRNYALLTDDEYDVISIDATTPKMAGNGSLYTLEFYELLAERLSSNGLVVQWLPFHLLSDAEMRMIAKTFMTAFPHASLWFSPLRHHSILVGTQQRLEIDFRALRDRLARESIQQELAYFAPETDPIDFLGWFLMGEEALARYVGDARLNTDGHPYLEFTPAMAYFASDMFRIRNMLALREFRQRDCGGGRASPAAVRGDVPQSQWGHVRDPGSAGQGTGRIRQGARHRPRGGDCAESDVATATVTGTAGALGGTRRVAVTILAGTASPPTRRDSADSRPTIPLLSPGRRRAGCNGPRAGAGERLLRAVPRCCRSEHCAGC